MVPSKDQHILIVGAGVFGLSTALHLVQGGYTNITILDREAVPSSHSAGNDLNKIVRAEYEDPFYTELALNAIQEWQTPFWSDFYRPTGYLLATSINAPQKARETIKKSFASIKDHPRFPAGSFSPVDSLNDIKKYIPELQGKMEGWSGYLNRYAGYARAAKALEYTAKICLGLGVKFITGEDGYATEILFGSEYKGKQVCVGVKTASGLVHTASRTILCLGAHVGTLLPNVTQQVTAKSWAVAHIQLSPEEVAMMEGCPVVNCRDLGFFFEPDEDTGLIKLSANGAGYTNITSNAGTQASVPTSSNEGIPKEDEELIRRLIQEAMPQFSRRELVNKFICWCGDTSDSDYIIDYVPRTIGLLVVAGDSGHAFKMLPVAGKWVQRVLEDGEQSIGRWRWKYGKEKSDDISWRVGQVKDIKDVEFSSPRSRM
ncbi:FAD dependent oxidoreductase [Hyaloscypha variabilis F]|uniref:FAD dependent oxidoreductase n=1 Tax=Hyaloscypha variabilis (strain UAMH 11265 / GT02V1 / F) TaxID=1149755 RepID=A0A2J6RGR9_HYAVF|nr:FAD dependent oxidoreductase [Hyaloscypha variabilis F]